MPTDTKSRKLDSLPSPQDFCLTIPLYQTFDFDNEQENPFFGLEHFEGTLDMQCQECGKHSVFFLSRKADYAQRSYFNNYVFSLHFSCSRDQHHKALFIFHAHKGVLQKIGQHPSMADIAIPDLRKYRAVISEAQFTELSRGIGLAAHGVGVGAFVYLRRIFEALVEEAHGRAAADPAWSEEAFEAARMDEKIALLKTELPEFLVQNRKLYGILSVGVHTLTEAECLAAFPAVRVAIELILDGLLETHQRAAKVKASAKSLQALQAGLSRPGA